MTLSDLLNRIRDYYVDRLRQQLKAPLESPEHKVHGEDALLNAAGVPQTEGFLDLPLRIDMFVIKGENVRDSIIVDTEKMLSFDPVQFAWGDMSVRIAPFKWNSLRFTCPKADRSVSWDPLKAWFHQWFMPRGTVIDDEPAGIIHFLSDPKWDGDLVTFEADLGSAPIDAFEGLLDTLAKLPIKQVQFGMI